MSGNTWTVEWAGESVDDVRRTLIELGSRALVRCGSAGAVWRLGGWEELSGGRIGALLIPVDAHSVNPARRLPELPVPTGAHP